MEEANRRHRPHASAQQHLSGERNEHFNCGENNKKQKTTREEKCAFEKSVLYANVINARLRKQTFVFAYDDFCVQACARSD